VRVVIAMDKFRGTLSAAEACHAVANACWELGLDADEVPMSDGGEGLLDVLGGANRTTIVTGPLTAGRTRARIETSRPGSERNRRERLKRTRVEVMVRTTLRSP